MDQIIKKTNWLRRKTWAFYVVELAICAVSAYRFEMNWPLAVLSGGIFLVYVGAISTEKILLKWLDKKG
jgi:hypothetical protein